jgi:iron uptake system component EfeO
MRRLLPLAALLLALPACHSDNDLVLADAARDLDAEVATKALLVARAGDLHQAVTDLCAAAPAPAPSGWGAATDAAALTSMRDAWRRARVAHQHLEGVIDSVFSDLDPALDARYEAAIAAGADRNPFNAEGFVGLHAVERILWADRIPEGVVAAEAALDGYVAAAFPATSEEATDFRDGLCARLVADTATLAARLAATDLETPALYEAAVVLIEGQAEKLQEAAEGRDESRYAGNTLAEMRVDVAAAKATHAVFRAWLLTKTDGAHVDDEIAAAFAQLDQAYAAVAGDALPAVPAGWSPLDPSEAAAKSPFGVLFQAAGAAADDTVDGSLAHSMDEAAGLLGIHD